MEKIQPTCGFEGIRQFMGYTHLSVRDRQLIVDRLLAEAASLRVGSCRIFVVLPKVGSISWPLIGVVGAGATYRTVKQVFGSLFLRPTDTDTWSNVGAHDLMVATHQISNDRVTAFFALLRIEGISKGAEVQVDGHVECIHRGYFHKLVPSPQL